MANKGDIYKVALPNGDEYNFKDKYVRENYRALNNNDFDTINVTELNSGNIINTGAARFLNPINGACTDGTAGTTKYMRQDGTWQVPPNDNTTYTLDTNGNNIRLKNQGGTVISTITAPYATNANYILHSLRGSSDLDCLQQGFATLPKSVGTTARLEHGSHAMGFGWFLNGYDYDHAYGGWFISEYANPKWIGVNNGTWVEYNFIHSGNIGSQSVNYATTAGSATDNTKVLKAGDTMTGALQIGSSSQSALPSVGLTIHDVRNTTITSTCLNRSVNFFFTNKSTDRPSAEGWSSIMHVQGWNGTENYNSWELLGPAGTGDQRTSPLYVRSSNEGTWGDWRKIYDTSNKPSKSDVGLGNVDNTADANKSVNYATSAGSATSATNDNDGNKISTTYVKKSGDTMSGPLCVNATGAQGSYDEGIRINAGKNNYSSLVIGGATNSTTGTSDKTFWIGTNIENASYYRKLFIAHNNSTASATYFYANSATDYSPSLQVGGLLSGRGVVAANTANSSTAGGLALYGTSPTDYGIAFRGTGNGGKHGYVQGDWAQYYYMAGADTRGWVFNAGASTGVASISRAGHMVLNGSLTVGGNATNTSGVRQVYNSTTQSLDFVFVA